MKTKSLGAYLKELFFSEQNFFESTFGRFLGIPFSQHYEENANLGTNVYKQSYFRCENTRNSFLRQRKYLYGLVESEFYFYDIKGEYYKVKLLGIKVFSYVIGPEGKFCKILNVKLPKQLKPDYPKLFNLLKEYVAYKTGQAHSNIINLFCYSGEINYLGHFFHNIKEISSLDKRVFTITSYSCKDMLAMYKITDPVVLIPYFFMRLGFCDTKIFEYGDGTICNKFIDYQFFKSWEKVFDKCCEIDFINQYFKLDLSDCRMPCYSSADEDVVDSFLKANHVTLPFIIVNPASVSTAGLPLEFWQELCRELAAKGYVCIINAESDSQYACLGLCCFFSHAQFRYLASLAHAFIGLRSGLTATVVDLVTIHAFIGNIGRNPSAKALNMWPLNKNIRANEEKIFEYDINKYSHEALIRTVLASL